MNTKWTSKQDGILIDFVKNHDALYNSKNRDYRNTQLKQVLWYEIAAVLNKSDSDCCKRWGYVRDYYIRRKGKPGTGGEATRKRSERLSFLDHLPTPQRHSIAYVSVEEENPGGSQDNSTGTPSQNTETEIMVFDTTIETSEKDNLNKSIKFESSEEDDDDDMGITNVDNKGGINTKSDMKRKNTSHISERLSSVKQNAQPHIDDKTSMQNSLDENDLFFSSMAKIVKRLPKYEQAHLRIQIGSLVGNAELRHSSND